jgi:hypothetical protein
MGMVMLKFYPEPLLPLITEAMPMMREHWAEIAVFKDSAYLNPDLATAEILERRGMIASYAARDVTGTLVGYAVFILARLTHNAHVMAAEADLFYLDPSVRRGSNAARFLVYCADDLRLQGATRIRHRVKVAHDWSRLLERLGYTETERTFEMVI